MSEFARPALPENVYKTSLPTGELKLTDPGTPGILLRRMEQNIKQMSPNPAAFLIDLVLLDQSQVNGNHITDRPATRDIILQIGERKEIYEAELRALQEMHQKLQSPDLDKSSEEAKDAALMMQAFLRNAFLLGMDQATRHPAIAGVINALAQQYFPESSVDSSAPPAPPTRPSGAATAVAPQPENAIPALEKPLRSASDLINDIVAGKLSEKEINEIPADPDGLLMHNKIVGILGIEMDLFTIIHNLENITFLQREPLNISRDDLPRVALAAIKEVCRISREIADKYTHSVITDNKSKEKPVFLGQLDTWLNGLLAEIENKKFIQLDFGTTVSERLSLLRKPQKSRDERIAEESEALEAKILFALLNNLKFGTAEIKAYRNIPPDVRPAAAPPEGEPKPIIAPAPAPLSPPPSPGSTPSGVEPQNVVVVPAPEPASTEEPERADGEEAETVDPLEDLSLQDSRKVLEALRGLQK